MKDHLNNPVKNILVGLAQRQLFRQGKDQGEMPCPDRSTSDSNGLAVFICNVPNDAVRAVLTVRKSNL